VFQDVKYPLMPKLLFYSTSNGKNYYLTPFPLELPTVCVSAY